MIAHRPPGASTIGEHGEEALELLELGVDRDPQRLEGPGRGVDLGLALLDDRDRLRDHRGELESWCGSDPRGPLP